MIAFGKHLKEKDGITGVGEPRVDEEIVAKVGPEEPSPIVCIGS